MNRIYIVLCLSRPVYEHIIILYSCHQTFLLFRNILWNNRHGSHNSCLCARTRQTARWVSSFRRNSLISIANAYACVLSKHGGVKGIHTSELQWRVSSSLSEVLHCLIAARRGAIIMLRCRCRKACNTPHLHNRPERARQRAIISWMGETDATTWEREWERWQEAGTNCK